MKPLKNPFSEAIAYIGLGTNLGDKRGNLINAAAMLGSDRNINLLKLSSLYRTPAWGNAAQPCFLNAVARIKTALAPEQLLTALKQMEKSLGRKTVNGRYQPRLIDMDIIFYDDKVVNAEDLIIPHPHLHKRRFVLAPMNELAPNLLHPVYKRTIRHLFMDMPND
jgi:2-amino-4-hydroxy-6-hydroxymethyldihydropteridine diphosphokinase